MFEDEYIKYDNRIRESLRIFKRDLLTIYGVLSIAEVIIIYLLLRIS